MRALATLVIFVCVSCSVAHAASFGAKDITKFGRAHGGRETGARLVLQFAPAAPGPPPVAKTVS